MKELTAAEVANLVDVRKAFNGAYQCYEPIIKRVMALKVNSYLQVNREDYKGSRTARGFGDGLKTYLRTQGADARIIRLFGDNHEERGWIVQRTK